MPSDKFKLADLGNIMKKKDQSSSTSAPKPRVMTTRSSKSAKKRKSQEQEIVNVEDSSEWTASDLCQQLGVKIVSEREGYEKALEESASLLKIATGKAKYHEDKNTNLSKELAETGAKHAAELEKAINKGKESAAAVAFEAQIMLAREAHARGLDIWTDEINDWIETYEELTGEKMSPPKADPVKTPVAAADVGKKTEDGSSKVEKVVEKVPVGDDGGVNA